MTEAARDVSDLAAIQRSAPERWRLVLTNDQLFDPMVIWTMGSDPFEFAPRSEQDDADRGMEFRTLLERGDPDAPWDPIGTALLDADLKAFHLDP